MPPSPDAPVRTYLDAWHEMLDADPDDFAIRGLMADWYADQGDPAAEDCLRWQVGERKRPYKPPEVAPGGLVQWYDGDYGNGYDPESDLPAALWSELRGGETWGHRSSKDPRWVEYPTRRAAEEALLAAWRKLAARGQAPGRKEES